MKKSTRNEIFLGAVVLAAVIVIIFVPINIWDSGMEEQLLDPVIGTYKAVLDDGAEVYVEFTPGRIIQTIYGENGTEPVTDNSGSWDKINDSTYIIVGGNAEFVLKNDSTLVQYLPDSEHMIVYHATNDTR